MKRFTPNYTVSYQGVFYPAKEPFDIADEDVEMMQPHGTVEEEIPQPDPVEEEPPKRRKSK